MRERDAPTLVELQREFITYLTDDENSVERLIAEQMSLSPAQRLSIYSSAYRIRLHEALENDHEMLGWYLGDDQFAQMADSYIAHHPSHVTSLRHFGRALPKFLADTEPYRSMPVLADLAEFERLLLDVFDAADATRVEPRELTDLPVSQWPSLHLRFHPSVQLLHLRTNAIPIWQALKQKTSPPPVETDIDSNWLLWRGTDRLSVFRTLSTTEQRLLRSAIGGDDFATMCENLLDKLSPEAISETVLKTLLEWLEQGLVHRLNTLDSRASAS